MTCRRTSNKYCKLHQIMLSKGHEFPTGSGTIAQLGVWFFHIVVHGVVHLILDLLIVKGRLRMKNINDFTTKMSSRITAHLKKLTLPLLVTAIVTI